LSGFTYAFANANAIGPGTDILLQHNPANPIDGNAIRVVAAADSSMIGHLRYQVAEPLAALIQQQGQWSVRAMVTGYPYQYVDGEGRIIVECNLNIVVEGMDYDLDDDTVLLLEPLFTAADFPYDNVH
jgi:hypothetical protein